MNNPALPLYGIAIVAVTIIELTALTLGINGIGLSAAIGAITAIAGYITGKHRRTK